MKMVRRTAALLLALAVSFTSGYTDITAASVSDSSGYVTEEGTAGEAGVQEENEISWKKISQGQKPRIFPRGKLIRRQKPRRFYRKMFLQRQRNRQILP